MAVYTLFSQGATGSTLASDPTAYTMGVQFSVTQTNCTLTGMWFYSASGAAGLPNLILLYDVTSQLSLHQETPTWSGAAGTGWVRASFASPPSLTSGTQYKAAVSEPSGINWYTATANYWSSGAGGSGITNGPLTAPNNAGAAQGQDTFTTNIPGYPTTSFNSSNYWVDPEITQANPPININGVTALVTVAAIPGLPAIVIPGTTANVAVHAVAGTPTILVPPVAKWLGSVLQSGPQGSFFP